ncbi:MAG: hypothetical protein HY901_17295, partial [Deltaproteobacteria bacterium]|nr:hypothetical protein [Deltaproteobacteria bacterium]
MPVGEEKRELLVAPGHVVVPGSPARLHAVVGSGVAVTLFSARLKVGGMCHFCRPRRERGVSTAWCAAPAIVGLTRIMEEQGAGVAELRASAHGGAENPAAPGYVAGLAQE